LHLNQYHRSMKILTLFLFLCLTQLAQSQYYYNDIAGARSLGERMKDYAANKVKTVTATGYDKQGVKTTDFNEWQEVDPSQNLFRIATRNGQQVNRQTYQFDNKYRLLSIRDSSIFIKSVSSYTYDANDNIVSIRTVTEDQDTLTEFSETEERQWTYSGPGKPQRMLRILNGKDSSEYRFTIDEQGNVIDEQLFRRGTGIDPIYYYYDKNKRLTDIVRYNKRMKALMADMMFEYDDNNRMIQKITTLSVANPDYLIWRYVFDERGLKTKEALFDKQKQLTGRIDYQYSFF
jgi:hypothetical protein